MQCNSSVVKCNEKNKNINEDDQHMHVPIYTYILTLALFSNRYYLKFFLIFVYLCIFINNITVLYYPAILMKFVATDHNNLIMRSALKSIDNSTYLNSNLPVNYKCVNGYKSILQNINYTCRDHLSQFRFYIAKRDSKYKNGKESL